MSIISDLLGLFFPDLCSSCEKRLVSEEKHICLTCLNTLPKTGFHTIPDNKLEQVFAGRFPFERIASFAYFVKGGTIQSIIHSLKYKNNPELGTFIGQLCGKELLGSGFLDNIDYIIPVPLHPVREKSRGYNQSQKIAEGLSLVTNVPLCCNTLVRVVNNVSQTKQSKFERWVNMDGVFKLNKPSKLAGKHVLLLDDIITTGSTLESCIKAILSEETDVKISVYSIGAVI